MNTKLYKIVLFLVILLSVFSPGLAVEAELSRRDTNVKQLAKECRDEIVRQFTKLISQNQLTSNQLFDTFYIPIPKTNPQKFHTQYDKLTDIYLLHILDKYLSRNKYLIYVVAVDRNGYLPTHNSKYSKFLTGDDELDAKNNRTKRIFNDRTGLAAARNTEDFFLQKYNRDTGESMADLSVPIFMNNRHWGAVRIGYFRD